MGMKVFSTLFGFHYGIFLTQMKGLSAVILGTQGRGYMLWRIGFFFALYFVIPFVLGRGL